MAVLLGLPNEALLRIFHYLLQSVKHPKPQADLLSLILTCKRLAPLVREVLFTTPILHPCKIDIFLTTLFKYPDLQSKIQSLALESNKIHRSWVISDPARVRGQDAEISSKCAGILHTLKLDEEVKQECIHVLQDFAGIPPGEIIPPKLETLVLTQCRRSMSRWLKDVTLAQETSFPSLRSLSMYRQSWKSGHPPSLLGEMKRLGITFYDYYPKGLEFYHELNHPWLYTQAELDAFNAMRHEETQELKKR